jgi:glutathione S-transferase
MKLYGTTTSPFVRRVRIVAAELGVAIERVDTASDHGQQLLREVSPIRKVPVAVLSDATTVFDSREIVARLVAAHGGWGPLAPDPDPNALAAIEAAIDSIIQLFYLRRDGIAIDGTPYAERQLGRTDAIFEWLGGRVSMHALGFVEISTICALDWMAFRKTYPLERAGAALLGMRAAWKERASIADTYPHA